MKTLIETRLFNTHLAPRGVEVQAKPEHLAVLAAKDVGEVTSTLAARERQPNKHQSGSGEHPEGTPGRASSSRQLSGCEEPHNRHVPAHLSAVRTSGECDGSERCPRASHETLDHRLPSCADNRSRQITV